VPQRLTCPCAVAARQDGLQGAALRGCSQPGTSQRVGRWQCIGRCLPEGRNLTDVAQCPNVTGVQPNSAWSRREGCPRPGTASGCPQPCIPVLSGGKGTRRRGCSKGDSCLSWHDSTVVRWAAPAGFAFAAVNQKSSLSVGQVSQGRMLPAARGFRGSSPASPRVRVQARAVGAGGAKPRVGPWHSPCPCLPCLSLGSSQEGFGSVSLFPPGG